MTDHKNKTGFFYSPIGFFLRSVFVIGCVGFIGYFVFFSGSSGASNTQTKPNYSYNKQTIQNDLETWITDATVYGKDKIEFRENLINVWINLDQDYATQAEEYTLGLARRIANHTENAVIVNVSAISPITGSDDIRYFGTAIFRPTTDEFEFDPEYLY